MPTFKTGLSVQKKHLNLVVSYYLSIRITFLFRKLAVLGSGSLPTFIGSPDSEVSTNPVFKVHGKTVFILYLIFFPLCGLAVSFEGKQTKNS